MTHLSVWSKTLILQPEDRTGCHSGHELFRNVQQCLPADENNCIGVNQDLYPTKVSDDNCAVAAVFLFTKATDVQRKFECHQSSTTNLNAKQLFIVSFHRTLYLPSKRKTTQTCNLQGLRAPITLLKASFFTTLAFVRFDMLWCISNFMANTTKMTLWQNLVPYVRSNILGHDASARIMFNSWERNCTKCINIEHTVTAVKIHQSFKKNWILNWCTLLPFEVTYSCPLIGKALRLLRFKTVLLHFSSLRC